MSSKLFKVRSIFVLLVFFCASVLSAGINLEPYPKTAKAGGIRAWVGSKKYHPRLDRAGLIAEAEGTLKLLQEKKRREGGDWRVPSVVSALTTGDGDTYFASSARGKGDIFSHPDAVIDQNVRAALEECGGKHRNDGKCGEVMVIAEWYRSHPGKKLSEEHSKLIVSVEEAGIKDPCSAGPGSRGDYGCKDFLEKTGFKENEIIRRNDEQCEISKRSIRGKAYHNKACAMILGAKVGKQPHKKAKATCRKQPHKKPSTAQTHSQIDGWSV